ncbi:Apoptotic chromatin condensation inducer in the nucleus, partial [Kickxella alabastrina]
MSELIPSELKVTDLRKELVARNLPTNGLKKDLVQRLEESLGISGERVSGSQLGTDDQIDLLPADEQDEVDEETAEHVLEGPIDAMETGEAEENGLKRNNDWGSNAPVAHADLNADAGADADADDQMDTSGQQHLQAGSGVLDSMYIKNLERPLTVYRIKELLGKHGSVDDVWLNAIKTRGYARFTSVEEAQAAFASINGTRFPPEHGKIL